VFGEVRRILRDDGTCWINLGDSYASNSCLGRKDGGRPATMVPRGVGGAMVPSGYSAPQSAAVINRVPDGCKPKDLLGIPWAVAFALRDDGWYLRQDIIWSKPNPMPESVRDRCTKAHEYLFLLSKNARYYFDAEAIAEPFADERNGNPGGYKWAYSEGSGRADSGLNKSGGVWNADGSKGGRNKRSVWTVTPTPFPGAHFAVMPAELVRPCVLAGSPAGGVVLDPFAGSGTTLAVAVEERRRAVGIELNPEYHALIRKRLRGVTPALV